MNLAVARGDAGVKRATGPAIEVGVSAMGRAIVSISGSAAGLVARPLFRIGPWLGALWRELTRDSPVSYRPERHYMRGPGPKWRAKHGCSCPRSDGVRPIPTL